MVALFMWVTIIMILQPIFSYRDYLIDNLFKSYAFNIAQQAAVEGYVTPSLKQDLVEKLKKIGFSEDEIELTYSTIEVDRGTAIDIKLKGPRPPSFPYFFGSNSPNDRSYYAHVDIMSEHLD